MCLFSLDNWKGKECREVPEVQKDSWRDRVLICMQIPSAASPIGALTRSKAKLGKYTACFLL